MKKLFFLLFICIMLLPLTNADESFTFQVDKEFTLEIPMSNADLSACSGCSCQISLFYPNGSILIRNGGGTNIDGDCQYKDSSKIIGIHGGQIYFTNGVDYGRSSFEFEITYTGDKLTTQEAYIYIISLIFMIIIIFALVYLINKLPTNDSVDDRNNILQINQMKHFRKSLWIIVWGLCLGIMFILSNFTLAYLTNSMLGKLFFVLYQIMFWFSIIAVPVWICWIFYQIWDDKEVQRMINRGVDIKSTP